MFLALYGAVAQCEQAVFAASWPKGFLCPSCGYRKSCQLRQRKVFQCIRCKHQASLTAGTLFDNTKLPLTTWFLAIYLLSQSKNGIAAMDLKRQLGVSYNTAWMLKHKLMQTMRERDDSQPLRGIVEIDDAYLGGETSGGKRGRGAARKTPVLSWVNTLLGNVKRAIDGTYHACEARYAGRYLAEFAYRFNRRYELADLVPRLVYVAVRTPPLPDRLLTLAGTAG